MLWVLHVLVRIYYLYLSKYSNDYVSKVALTHTQYHNVTSEKMVWISPNSTYRAAGACAPIVQEIAVVLAATIRTGSWSVSIYCMYTRANSCVDGPERWRQPRFCFRAGVWWLLFLWDPSSKEYTWQARLVFRWLGTTNGSIVWYPPWQAILCKFDNFSKLLSHFADSRVTNLV